MVAQWAWAREGRQTGGCLIPIQHGLNFPGSVLAVPAVNTGS